MALRTYDSVDADWRERETSEGRAFFWSTTSSDSARAVNIKRQQEECFRKQLQSILRHTQPNMRGDGLFPTQQVREDVVSVGQRVNAHHRREGVPREIQQIVTYVGQCVIDREIDTEEG